MNRRNIVTMVTALLLLYINIMQAQTRQPLTIDAATVYLSSAALSSSTHMNLPKDEKEVVMTNVANNVNTGSLIVNATNGVVVESVTFQNYADPSIVLSPKSRSIGDSIDVIIERRSFMEARIDALNEQITVIQGNRKVSSDNNGLSVAELTKLLDLINARMERIINDKNKQEKLIEKSDADIARLRQQLTEEQRKSVQPGGQLAIKFYTQEPVNTMITVTYAVPGAGWNPAYDIMADAVNTPLKLYYKANVYQSTGVKWDNVQLSLSSGNPSEGIQAPAINAWFLSLNIPAPQPVYSNSQTYTTMAYRKPLVNEDRPSHTLTREDIAVIPTTEVYDMASGSAGVYQSQRGANVNIGGARVSGTTYIIDGVQVQGQSSLNNYTTVNNMGINTTFDIDLPYTIPSDGQQHAVSVKKYQLPATYRYYAVPKLDKDVFLQAQVTNWADMNLLPGQTNIFYEGSYVGQGYIDIHSATDTMLISLGRDKRIMIKRESDKKLRSVKNSGSNIRETFAYTITIRNTRKEKVNLIVEDQIPVSNDNELVVEDKNTGESDYNEKTGVMTWTLPIDAAQTKKLSLGFTIRYPKDRQVVGLQ